MTTPTNDRQTSEREKLFANDPPLVKLAAILQALEFEPAAVNLSAEVLAAACRTVAGRAKDAAALRAENGRLLRERASEDVRLADVIAERDRLRAENEAEIAQLRTDLARLRLTHTETAANLAAADEQVRVSDEIIAALRAENEALRTAGDELMEACKQRDNALIDRTMSRRLALDTVDLDAIHEAVAAASRRYNAALQSFIRSKESRRG